jgi:hypothetical protein
MLAVPFATQTVTVWRAPTVIDHGNDVDDWDNATSRALTGCSVQPGGGNEDRDNRDAITTVWTVYADLGADVTDRDRVEVNGVRYDIDGPIRRYETGVLDHLEIPLRNVEG